MEQGDKFDEDDDDCVIFEGSPLYASLVQSGSLAEELNIEQKGQYASHETQRQTGMKTAVLDKENKSWLVSQWSYITIILNSLWQKVKSRLLPDLSDSYKRYEQTVIDEMSRSVCLEDDDKDFVKFYIHNSPVPGSKESTLRVVLRPFKDLTVLSVAVYITGYLYNSILKKSMPLDLPIIAFIAAHLGFIVFREGRYFIHSRKCKTMLYLYRDFIHKNEEMTKLVKKCLRLVQETELISRGFTLVSQRNPLSRLEGGQTDIVTRQCPVLRKLVFMVARETVLLFRQMTKKLFNIHPLSKELDIHGTYLAFEPLQSYGPCLQVDIEDTDELFTVTDGYSISALKGISHLCSLHQSEFIKALVLVHHDRMEKGNLQAGYLEINILQDTSSKLEDLTGSLQKSFTYHSCAWMTKEPANREPVKRDLRTQSDVENIYVAVHSLDLHLQAALTRVKHLTDIIESLSDTADTNLPIEEFLHHMQPIRAELESSKGCWEESINRIEKAAGKSSYKEDEMPLKKGDTPAEETQKTEELINSIEDYIIEDQVFEGFTDAGDLLADYEWELPLTAAEKEKKRREKEEALRMLSELKSVISVRAADTEQREKVALLKMHPDRKIELEGESKPNRIEQSCSSEEENDAKSRIDTVGRDSDIVKEKACCEDTNNSKKTVDNAAINDKLTSDLTKHKCLDNKDKIFPGDYETDGSKKDNVHSLETTMLGGLDRDVNKHSIITGQGVRRLRKSNVLDLSDSDLEDYPEEDSSEQYTDDCNVPRLGLPPRNLCKVGEYETGDENIDIDSEETHQVRLPMCSLQERLETLSGANLSISSVIAEQAVARSKLIGLGEETTFGGDVYRECSSESDDVNEGDNEDEFDDQKGSN